MLRGVLHASVDSKMWNPNGAISRDQARRLRIFAKVRCHEDV